MKNINYSTCAAVTAAVLLFIANFLPGLSASVSEMGSSASVSCSVYGTSHLAGCLNWIAVAALLFALFCKADRFSFLARKDAKFIIFGAAACVAIIAFIIILVSNSVSVNLYGIEMSVSLSGEVMDMIRKELPAGVEFGKGLGCWIVLVGTILAGAAAVLEYMNNKEK